jgi:putative NADPH-quinone reductase
METKPLIILGSARHDSDTKKLVHVLFPAGNVKVLDLLDYIIYPYSYEGRYPADDRFTEVCNFIRQHEQVVFCTPVYWYAMSGLMKIFFDRLTDLVTIQKKTGRSMAGKETYMLAVGAEEALPPGFEVPFKLTSACFDMAYRRCYYCRTKEVLVDSEERTAFLKDIYKVQKS